MSPDDPKLPPDPTLFVGSATDISPLTHTGPKPGHEKTATEEAGAINWEAIAASARFKDLMRAKRRFIVPATIFFVAYYFALPVLVGYARQLMESACSGRSISRTSSRSRSSSWPGSSPGSTSAPRTASTGFETSHAPRNASSTGTVEHEQGAPLEDHDTPARMFLLLRPDHARHHLLGGAPLSAAAYFAAGRRITGWQNGIAVAGDYMSAASFLGIAGIIAFQGYDGFMYSVGWLVAYLTVLLIVAEPLRNAGKYTMADVLAYRLNPRPVRAMAALSTLTVSTFYMIAQMVGAGALVALLLAVAASVTTGGHGVGILMIVYVVFGGMLATTWVQIIKAILLMAGTILLSILVLAHFHFSFDDSSTPIAHVTYHDKGELVTRTSSSRACATSRHTARST